jgi:hypothetical protein
VQLGLLRHEVLQARQCQVVAGHHRHHMRTAVKGQREAALQFGDQIFYLRRQPGARQLLGEQQLFTEA